MGFVSGMAFVLLLTSMVQAQDQKKGQFRGGFGGFGGPGGGFMANPADLLGIAEVQKELSVSDEQKGLIEDMVADLREQRRGLFSGFQPDARASS